MKKRIVSERERGLGVKFIRTRRITGYLVYNTNTWNTAKLAELNDRVTHNWGEKMTRLEEYTMQLKDAANPDKVALALSKITDMIQEDLTKINNYETSLTEANNRIRDLQDTNIKLFLSQTGEKKDEDEQEAKVTSVDDMVSKILSKEDK